MNVSIEGRPTSECVWSVSDSEQEKTSLYYLCYIIIIICSIISVCYIIIIICWHMDNGLMLEQLLWSQAPLSLVTGHWSGSHGWGDLGSAPATGQWTFKLTHATTPPVTRVNARGHNKKNCNVSELESIFVFHYQRQHLPAQLYWQVLGMLDSTLTNNSLMPFHPKNRILFSFHFPIYCDNYKYCVSQREWCSANQRI